MDWGTSLNLLNEYMGCGILGVQVFLRAENGKEVNMERVLGEVLL